MKIQLLPAENGDCILVEHAPGHYFVIDGGYVDTARTYLIPRLKQISGAGGVIDVMVVTHIDGDHISGIIEYMNQKVPVPVGEIWYNGFRHIQSIGEPLPMSEVREYVDHMEITKEVNPPQESLCSGSQGCTLSALITKRNIPWNVPAGGNVMKAPMSFQVGESKIHLLSPTDEDLERLEKYWRKDLVDKKALEKAHSQEFWDDAYEWAIAKEEADKKGGFKQHAEVFESVMMIQDDIQEALEKKYEHDDSAANRSSIAFVLESSDGTRALLLGDAHAETVIASLKKLYGEDAAPYHFDVVKLAHHGSFNNTSPALLDLIRSDKWLVSTNSATFHHPDMATIANIVTRSTGNKIFFNYELDICKQLRGAEFKKYGFEIVTPGEKEVGMTVTVAAPVPASTEDEPAGQAIIDQAVLDKLTEEAKKSERLRMNYDLRNSTEDKSQRMLNAIEPGTVLPIHRHRTSSETVVCLRGHFKEYFYDETGRLTETIDMVPGGNIINIPVGLWHSLKSLESGTVLLEVKDGPWEPLAAEDILDI